MKQIGVEPIACYGSGCDGFSYSTESNITIDVDDTTYQTLAAIKPENEEIDGEDDEEDHPVFNFYDYRRDYLEWVKSHTDDYGFIADRVGVDLNAVYEDLAELEFTISITG